jgi:hypothetical protein
MFVTCGVYLNITRKQRWLTVNCVVLNIVSVIRFELGLM